jgi:hypothetical protein
LSDDNVILLSDKRGDARMVSVTEMLSSGLKDFDSGKEKSSKAVLIFLRPDEEIYDYQIRVAGMTASQIVALLETVKNHYVLQLNGVKR